MTFVLLLSATSAKWIDVSAKDSQWHEVDLSEEAVVPDSSELHLLLDSDFEQVDAFPIAKSNSAISHRSNLRAMHARFAHQYPFSIVRSHQRKTGVDCFLVHHVNIDVSITRYLQLLESKHPCSVIVSMQSISELYVSAYAKSEHTRLLLIRTESGFKHVVGQSGCVLFCRTVALSKSNPFPVEQIVASLTETIEHLRNKELFRQVDSITAVGISHNQAHQLEAHTETLMQPLQFEVVLPSVEDVQPFLASQATHFAKKHKRSQYRKTGQWLQKNSGRARSRQIRIAALASVVLASAAILISLQHGNKKRVEKEQLQVKLHELSAELAETQQAAETISDQHDEISEILLDLNSLNSVKAPDLEQLLQPLSEALQARSTINIKELSWVAEEVAEDGLSQSASRTQFPIDGASPSTLLVSLIGRVQGAGSVRIKQDSFKQFVMQLQNNEHIEALDVVQSPLDSAAPQSIRVTQDQSVARFEVTFTLSRS